MLQWKCTACGTTGWARGWDEPDVNACGINDDDPMEGACEHVIAGGDYEIVDYEESRDDDY